MNNFQYIGLVSAIVMAPHLGQEVSNAVILGLFVMFVVCLGDEIWGAHK